MIPKIIHYCWYGRGEMSIQIKETIDSWRKQCPDYELKLWTEDNSPIKIPYLRDALKHHRWAFAADYMRFYALYHEGGVYMDTDMYLIKPLDEFLSNEMFVGREDKYLASMGIIGMKKGNKLAKYCLDKYNHDGFNVVHPPIVTCMVTENLYQYGFIEEDKTQHLTNGLVVYQSDYFYPIHYTHKYPYNEILEHATANSRGIHWGCGSWGDEFKFLEKKQYSKGFDMAWEHIKRTPFLPWAYWKKLIKYIGRYLGLWKR